MSDEPGGSAFEFMGDWREFAPIAFTNLLLSIVTLGIYSFWARARERRYLWSRTRFIDERLEWTGTGLELFIGMLLAGLLLFVPVAALNFLIQALFLRGHNGLAALLMLGFYFLVFYLIGLAIFRALRYRLSRTYWRGIRGGSDDQGFAYGVSHLWKTLAGALVFGLLVPWSMVALWNERWNAMSFGPHRFEAGGRYQPLMARYVLCYLAPVFALFAVGMVVGAMVEPGPPPAEPPASLLLAFAIGYFVFFVVFGLVALVFYSAYFREVVGELSLDTLSFGFDARTLDWVKLFLGNIALVVFTLGIGAIFLGYRNWSFLVRHLHAYGEVNLDTLTQSTTRMPSQGEGLLDAFDIGAV